MKKALFLLSFAFLLFSHQSLAQDEPRASAAWQVLRYDITATLPQNPSDRNLAGKAALTLKNVGRGAGSTATFRINPKAEIVGAKVGAANADFRKIADDKLGGLQRFSVSLPGSIQPNENVTISIDYRLNVAENSGLNSISPTASQFLPLAAWYPTPNNPYSPRGADYAPFRLSVNAPNGANVVSSGRTSAEKVTEQNLYSQPFFVTGEWETIETPEQAGKRTETSFFAYLPKGASEGERKQAIELLKFTAEARNYIAGLLGSENVPAYKLVAVRRGAGFSDGGTILLDSSVFRRSKLDALTAGLIAESVARIWLGNTVSLRAEGQGALREGLAQFIATQFIEKQFGKDVAEIQRVRQRTAYSTVAKREAPISQSSPLDETYYASTANKGAMIWRLAARAMGEDKFFSALKTQLQGAKNGGYTLADIRQNLSGQNATVKQILDFGFDQLTDADLLIGLPQPRGAETVVALRNTGSLPVTVNVAAFTDKGERLNSTANIGDKNFGEAVFKTAAKIIRVEVDPEKFYPQLDYSNDSAPRSFSENDLQAEIIRSFNRQEFAKSEAAARKVLQMYPRLDDARSWLGRSLLEQNRLDEAEKEFNTALSENLPVPRTLAWSNIGLGEIALKRNQKAQAAGFFNLAVNADAEYASNLIARNRRIEAEAAPQIDEASKTFFASFDKAVLSKQKSQVDALILPGELTRFSGGITGNQPEQWQTRVTRSELLDANHLAVDVSLNTKIINREPASGTALFILAKTANGWRLAAVDLFEVR